MAGLQGETTLACTQEGCSETFTAENQLNAGKKRKAHLAEVHGIVTQRKNQKTPRGLDDILAQRPAAQVVSITKTIQDAGKPKGAAAHAIPKRDEWEKKLGLVLGLGADFRTNKVVNRSRLPEEEKDAFVERLSMDPEECEAVVIPIAGLITEGPLSPFNKKYGRQVLDLLDIIPALIAIISFEQRLRKFERDYGIPRQPRQRIGATNGNVPQPEPSPQSYEGISIYGPGSQ